MRRVAPGMIAVGAGLGCALVASLLARDAFDHWFPRLGIAVLAAIAGMVVALRIAARR